MTARFRVVATTRFGGRRLVYHHGNAKFSWFRGRHGKVWMTAAQADAAKRWTTRRLARDPRAVPAGRWPFLELGDGAAWPTDKRLLRKLNRIGQRLKRPIRIASGRRTLQQQQALWDRYQRYLNGGPFANRAAYPDDHAPHIRGVAADVGVIGRKGYVSYMDYSGKARKLAARMGLSARVPGEAWHLQRDVTY